MPALAGAAADDADDHIDAEMDRAQELLADLPGHDVTVLSVASPAADDAVFLGRNISKLSPIVSNLLESQIIRTLSETPAEHGYSWRRQDPAFPDAGLFDPNGEPTGHGFEVKAWYVLATEITARFKESQRLLEGRDVRIVLVPWIMSHVVYGTPRVLDVLVVDAADVARVRDEHYHDPPDYLVVEPADTDDRTANLQQSNVIGHKLQEISEADLRSAELIAERFGAPPLPHDEVTRELNRLLLDRFNYRAESNFAKLHRVKHPAIVKFQTDVLDTPVRGATPRQWRSHLSSLGSSSAAVRAEAEAKIAALYEEEGDA